MGSKPLATVKESAKVFNVSIWALYRKLQHKELPSYRFGKKILIDLDEIRDSMRIPPKDTL